MALHTARRNEVTRHRLINYLFVHLMHFGMLDIHVGQRCLCAYSLDSKALAQTLDIRRGARELSAAVE
jgi:hypothetical protein